MAKYNLFIKPSASREIETANSKKVRQRIISQIMKLADDPRPIGTQKLSGGDKYRIRCGDFRILYLISDADLAVIVVKIGHRKKIYR